MKRIPLFTPGTHTAMSGQTITFGESDLTASASVYDPALHESPLVIGHPKTDAPAYGWVKDLEFADGELVAIPHQVDAGFADLVANHRYKKISASFYPPNHPGNPTPGKYYLRHVGFLGAQPPAVKGLRPVEFADVADDGFVTIEFGEIEPRSIARMFRGLRDLLIEKFGQEDADKALPGWETDWVIEQAAQPEPEPETATSAPAFSETPEPSPDPKPAPKPKEDKVTEEELKQREAEIAKREAEFAETQARSSAIEFADGLIRDGKLVPAQKDQVVALVTHLAVNADGAINFAEGTAPVSPVDALKSVLSAASKAVDFSEHSAADTNDGGSIDFADPTALATAATAFRNEQAAKGITISHSQAVRHIKKEAGK
ncbi:peptidase [Thalassospira xiamenensis]|uniref:Peptidase n=1 Tax=Thalassospira xiamenensis TaxID=220697 RepID=A0A367XHR9_9PROT|nr:peptidase [Thalassospira xiamenensis]RCK53196.1 hypothetical protein TH44_03105 [Thalassospira xiamenensis]